MRLRLPLIAAALVIVSALAAPSARAGSLAGKLELPPDVGAPPVLPRGYLPRIDNPLAPVRPLDPLPAMVVVLVPANPELVPAGKPATVNWELRGDSFARPVVAARLGDAIESKNAGRARPVLVAPGQAALLANSSTGNGDIAFCIALAVLRSGCARWARMKRARARRA